jgi:hypothetical protein
LKYFHRPFLQDKNQQRYVTVMSTFSERVKNAWKNIDLVKEKKPEKKDKKK